MAIITYSDISDGQKRHYSLIKEDCMYCEFTDDGNDSEIVGWCYWIRSNWGGWEVSTSSRGDGNAVAKPSFCIILDEIHMQLLVEMEVLR